MKIFLFLLIAYFIGALPSGVWLGKYFKKIDIRDYGSKNTGATNAYRVLGKKLGVLVLILDVLKGFLPIYLASFFIKDNNILSLIGFVTILAHTFSIFINFKGGKGVATTTGVFLFLSPYIILELLIIFMIVLIVTRYVSLSSIICAIFLPALIIAYSLDNFKQNIGMILLSLVISVFVVIRHKKNIDRLLTNTENKIFWRKK